LFHGYHFASVIDPKHLFACNAILLMLPNGEHTEPGEKQKRFPPCQILKNSSLC